MEFKSVYSESDLMTIGGLNNDELSGTVDLDNSKIEIIQDLTGNFTEIGDTASAANDLLQNGILVETNKGFVTIFFLNFVLRNLD